MIAGLGQERTLHRVPGLGEFTDRRLRLAVIVGESHRPAACYLGVVGSRGLEEAKQRSPPGMQRDVLMLAAQLDQDDLALQFIAAGIGDQAVLVTRHANFQVRAGHRNFIQFDPLGAVDQVTDDCRPRAPKIEPDGQFATRQSQHGAVDSQGNARRAGGRRVARGCCTMAGAEPQDAERQHAEPQHAAH
jgi:hypothetical protein